MWGIGWGSHWNSQHFFKEAGGWTSVCGIVWMRSQPQASKLPQCRDCKKQMERK